MASDSLTIIVAYEDGIFVASRPGINGSNASQHGPREAALRMAEEHWGKGDHVAVCSEVHGNKQSATFIITRAEVVHAA